MHVQLKQLEDQVIVITGASSGIGRTTARLAVARGAQVVLSARDETDLQDAVAEITVNGGQATHMVADVADMDALRSVATLALERFGRIDSWINNAGVAIYGRIEQVPLDDARRLFETNYWGVVNGSLIAAEYLRTAGGAIINVGSIASERAIPLQGHYSASKHAVKGFTDAFRMELEEANARISVTLVKPGAIDTPYPEHARNFMDAEPRHPPPVYTPDTVARAILHCCEHPRRDVTVGGAGKMITTMGTLAPRATDYWMEATIFEQQQRAEPGRLPQNDTLYAPRAHDARERGDQPGHVMRSSAYTQASLHPVTTLLGTAIVFAAIGSVMRGKR